MITIGADPELFLVDKEGIFKSAINLIGGSKRFPKMIREDGCALQEDNVAVEFNIPPSNDIERFVEAINFNLASIEELVREKGLSLSITASAQFDKSQLKSKAAREFGCDPDYNAWTRRINPRPKSADKSLRSAGGHIHIQTIHNPFHMARAMDLFVGVPSVLMDEDVRRRELYGKAGACRPKDYPGVEYRAVSNFWLKSDELKRWAFDSTQRAHEWLTEHGEEFDYLEAESERIQECINTSNKPLAEQIMRDYGI